MSQPRICIVVATLHPLIGGVQKQAMLQGKSLQKRGYKITILTFRHNKSWLTQELIEGIPVKRIAGCLLGSREQLPRWIQKAYYFLAMFVMGWVLWCSRRHYDVLHVYQLSLLTLPTAFVCLITGKPMLVAVRCADSGKPPAQRISLLPGPLDPNASYLQIVEPNWDSGDMEGLMRLGKPIVWLIKFLLQRINVIITILSSRMLLDLATHGFLFPRIRHIPNGVDLTRFIVRPATYQQDHLVVCVSRLYYQKGIDVLLQAWYLLQQQLPPRIRTRLLIVGDGPIQPQLQQMAQALGIAGTVEFVGMQQDIQPFLQRSTIAVLPSRWEGMPNALLEAMACGLPCIATRVSGSEDIIEHGWNGLLVHVEDYQALSEALLTLLCDHERAMQYGRVAHSTIKARYTLDQMLDSYEELYHSLMPPESTSVKNKAISNIYTC